MLGSIPDSAYARVTVLFGQRMAEAMASWAQEAQDLLPGRAHRIDPRREPRAATAMFRAAPRAARDAGMSHVNAPGRLLGSGRYTDVYDIGHGRVLRRYRDAAAVPSREAEVMMHARAHGVPVPEVFDASGTDIVMEHVPGPTMVQVLTRRPWTLGLMPGSCRLSRPGSRRPGLGWLRAPFGAGRACCIPTCIPAT